MSKEPVKFTPDEQRDETAVPPPGQVQLRDLAGNVVYETATGKRILIGQTREWSYLYMALYFISYLYLFVG